METRDYISLSALLIAVTSLFVSLRTSLFNKRAKCAEVRALVLSRAAAAILKAEQILFLYSDCKERALTAKQIDEFRAFNREDKIKAILGKLREAQSTALKATGLSAIGIYETQLPRIEESDLRLEDVSKDLEEYRDSQIQRLTPKDEKKRGGSNEQR
jgi:hypothetical protein